MFRKTAQPTGKKTDSIEAGTSVAVWLGFPLALLQEAGTLTSGPRSI